MAHAESSFKTPARTWANLPIRLKGLIVGSLPVAALMVSGILMNTMERHKDEGDARIHQAMDFRAQLQTLYIMLLDAESGVRNYALTGHENSLQALGVVGTYIDGVFDKVRDLIKDDANQLTRLSELRQLAHQRLTGLQELRDYYDAHKADGAAPSPELLAKARVSPDVLLSVSALGNAQGKLVLERAKADAASQFRFRVAIGACVVLGLLGGFLVVLLFTTSVVRRVQQLEGERHNSPPAARLPWLPTATTNWAAWPAPCNAPGRSWRRATASCAWRWRTLSS